MSQDAACPKCGYCPTCGRSNSSASPNLYGVPIQPSVQAGITGINPFPTFGQPGTYTQ